MLDYHGWWLRRIMVLKTFNSVRLNAGRVKVICIGLSFLGMRGCFWKRRNEGAAESKALAWRKANDEISSEHGMRLWLWLGGESLFYMVVRIYTNVKNGREERKSGGTSSGWETGKIAKFSVAGLPKCTKIGEFSSLYTGNAEILRCLSWFEITRIMHSYLVTLVDKRVIGNRRNSWPGLV